MELRSYEEIEKSIGEAQANAHGPDRYVIAAVLNLVYANQRLDTSINKLKKEITDFNNKAGEQTDKLVRLTWAIVALTLLIAALTVLTLVQK